MGLGPSITKDTGGIRRPVVFIAGLTHSGSTLLDLILGSNELFVGLGEVVPLLLPGSNKLYEPERICSCGLSIPRCPFWSRAVERLRKYEDASVPERYTMLLEVFAEVFGRGRTLVDSSKSLSSLEMVYTVPGVMLRVIHLLRDVRSWVVSRRDHDIRTRTATFRDLRKKFGHRAWTLYFRQNPLARSLVWYHGNVRIQEFLSKEKIPVFTLGYEELVLETAAVIEQLNFFLEGDLFNGIKDISGSNSHIVLGNRMRLDRARQSRVSYDHRWFRRREWEAPALLLPHVMQFNRRWVYGNVQQHSRENSLGAEPADRRALKEADIGLTSNQEDRTG